MRDLTSDLNRIMDSIAIDPSEPEPDLPDPDTREWIEHRRAESRQKVFEASIPARFSAACLDDLDQSRPAMKQIVEWWESDSQTLILVGGVGTGKTHAGYAVLRAAVASGARAYGATLLDLLAAMRPSAAPSPAPRLAVDADVFLFDDLATERATDWAIEQFGGVVDERTREGKRQIITTNATSAELHDRFGPRIMSRLSGGATICQFGGADLRKSLW